MPSDVGKTLGGKSACKHPAQYLQTQIKATLPIIKEPVNMSIQKLTVAIYRGAVAVSATEK